MSLGNLKTFLIPSNLIYYNHLEIFIAHGMPLVLYQTYKLGGGAQ